MEKIYGLYRLIVCGVVNSISANLGCNPKLADEVKNQISGLFNRPVAKVT